MGLNIYRGQVRGVQVFGSGCACRTHSTNLRGLARALHNLPLRRRLHRERLRLRRGEFRGDLDVERPWFRKGLRPRAEG